MADEELEGGVLGLAEEVPGGGQRPGRGARTTLLLGLLVVAAFLVGMAGVAVLSDRQGGPITQQASGGVKTFEDRVSATEQAPLPLMTLAGFGDGDPEPVELADYIGAPLIVNFWASWCAPCVSEMPDLQEFSDSSEIPLLGVNVQDAPSNAQAFVSELGITYDLASDPQAELYEAVRGFGMPTTLLVDASGTIVYRHTGPLDAAELRSLVVEHL